MFPTSSTQPQPEPVSLGVPAGSWRDAWLAALGHLFYMWWAAAGVIFDVLGKYLYQAGNMPAQLGGYIAGAILLIDLLVVFWCWRRGWPRWSFPYLGIVLTWMMLFIASLIRNDGSLLVFLAPLVGFMMVFLIFLGRWLKGLHSLYERLRGDWTLLGLAYFSCVPFMFVIILDETRYEYGIELVLSVILALGVFAYMRSASRLRRTLVLPVAVMVAGLIVMFYFLAKLDGWQSGSISSTIVMVIIWTALAIAPLLLVGFMELGRFAIDRWQQAVKSG